MLGINKMAQTQPAQPEDRPLHDLSGALCGSSAYVVQKLQTLIDRLNGQGKANGETTPNPPMTLTQNLELTAGNLDVALNQIDYLSIKFFGN